MKSMQFFLVGFLSGCPETVQTTTESPDATQASYSPLDGGPPPEALMGQTLVTEVNQPVPVATKASTETQQKQVRAGHHTVFSGALKCEGCSGPFIVKVAAFIRPTPTAQVSIGEGGDPQPPVCGVGGHGADVRFPPIIVEQPGPYEIAFPWHGYPVVVEVLHDKNGDGQPQPGEPFAVLHEGGALMGNEDREGLVVDFNKAPQMVGDGVAAPVNPADGPMTSP